MSPWSGDFGEPAPPKIKLGGSPLNSLNLDRLKNPTDRKHWRRGCKINHSGQNNRSALLRRVHYQNDNFIADEAGALRSRFGSFAGGYVVSRAPGNAVPSNRPNR